MHSPTLPYQSLMRAPPRKWRSRPLRAPAVRQAARAWAATSVVVGAVVQYIAIRLVKEQIGCDIRQNATRLLPPVLPPPPPLLPLPRKEPLLLATALLRLLLRRHLKMRQRAHPPLQMLPPPRAPWFAWALPSPMPWVVVPTLSILLL